MVQMIDRHIREKGYGTPVFECGGELSNYGEMGATFGLRAYGALRKAGVTTALRANGPSDMAVIEAGLIDYAIPNIGLIRDRDTLVMKAKCKGLWLYNHSEGRYGYGFFAWAKGATRRFHEIFLIGRGRPWDEFDGALGLGPTGAAPTRDGMADAVTFERQAAGCDDYDYLAMCEARLEAARQRHTPAARAAVAKAEKTLAFLREQCFTDYDYRGDPELGSEVGRDAGCKWSPDDFQKYRWLVAREIIRLGEVLQ